MGNPYFRFKQFTVWHNQCAMRVNTDGVLLGAWAGSETPATILDIGAGSGLIALMMAQRFPNASIHAVEIDPAAYNQARSNVNLSPWKSRIEVFNTDFSEFYKNCENKYNLIVSNPPYFSNSLKNEKRERTIARHNDSLPSEELIRGAAKLLSRDGCFSLVLPASGNDFESEAYINGLYCSRKLMVSSLPHKPFLRQLLEFRSTEACNCECSSLTIYNQPNEYSGKYIELTRDFYLNFK